MALFGRNKPAAPAAGFFCDAHVIPANSSLAGQCVCSALASTLGGRGHDFSKKVFTTVRRFDELGRLVAHSQCTKGAGSCSLLSLTGEQF
jgi:hypothetical protein